VAGRGAAEARESGGGEGEWLVLGLPAKWIRESVGRGNNRGERRDCGQARVGPILHPILATPFSSFSRFWAKSANSGAKIGNLNKAYRRSPW
jgi:hypothetical protein